MSITFNRNNKWVNLETFSTDEVVSYLSSQLNTADAIHFEVVAEPKFCNVVMARIDNVDFIIHADLTYIELSFDKSHPFEIERVIETITKWDKFSKTLKTFYVDIIKGSSHTIIFENGYTSCLDYRRKFSRYKQFLITEFKH